MQNIESRFRRFAGFDSLNLAIRYIFMLQNSLKQWNTKNNIGLVVGATHIDAMKRVRAAAPDLWFLVPGVGTQGGDLESAMKAGLRQDGRGMLINVSRGISRSDDPRKAAVALRDQIVNIKRNINREGR